MHKQQIDITPNTFQLTLPTETRVKRIVTTSITHNGKQDKQFVILNESPTTDVFHRGIYFKGETHALHLANLFVDKQTGQGMVVIPNNVSCPTGLVLTLTLELEERT